MNRLILAVFLLTAIAGQAWGQDWVEIGRNKSLTDYMDYDTFSFNSSNTRITFWIKSVFGKEMSRQMSSKKPASYSMQKFTADCTDGNLSSTEFHVYSKSGTIIYSENKYQNMSLIPGSISEARHKAACEVLSPIREKQKAAEAEKQAAEQAMLKKEEEQRKEAERKAEGLIVTTANEIRHNGKVIFTDKTATDVNAVNKYNISNKQILLVKFDYKGTDCDQKYKYFVAYSHGTVTESDMFGDCRPIGSIQERNNKIETEFEGNGMPKERIYFDGIELTKETAPPARKAKKANHGGILSIFK